MYVKPEAVVIAADLLIGLFVIFLIVVRLVVTVFLRRTVLLLVCPKESDAQTAITKKTAKIDFFIKLIARLYWNSFKVNFNMKMSKEKHNEQKLKIPVVFFF